MTLEEYQTFLEILRSEKSFECSEEKEGYHNTGYNDETIREDLEEAKEFRRRNDRNTMSDETK